MTKSSLALRDLPLWKKVQDRAGLVLLVSMTSLDESIREAMEPHTSSFSSRLDMLRAFKKAGCSVGVLAMPFLPGISDDTDSIRRLYSTCADADVDFIMPGGLTLRPGRQKEHYLRKLHSYRPDLLQHTLDLYREERQSGVPIPEAKHILSSRITAVQREFEIPNLLPHRCFVELLPKHDALRKRTLSDDWLETRFADAAADGELARVLQNKRLAHFTAAILREGTYFNYQTLKITDT